MAFKNAAADGESQAHAAPCLFGSEKRLEQPRQEIGRNPTAVIAYHNPHDAFFSIQLCDEPQIAALRHGIDGIHHERQQHLLDLCTVTEDRWKLRIKLRLYLNAGKVELMLNQP